MCHRRLGPLARRGRGGRGGAGGAGRHQRHGPPARRGHPRGPVALGALALLHHEHAQGADFGQAGTERRRQREQVKTYSTLLEEHLRRHNEDSVHLPASASSPECWVVRRTIRAAPKKLCAASVVETLRTLTMEQLRRFAATNDLSSAVQEFLRAKLSRQPTGRFNVSVQVNRPRPCQGAPAAPPPALDVRPLQPLPPPPPKPPQPPEPLELEPLELEPLELEPLELEPEPLEPLELEPLAPLSVPVVQAGRPEPHPQQLEHEVQPAHRLNPTGACGGYDPTRPTGGGEEARRLAGALRMCRDVAKSGAKDTRERLKVHEAATRLCEPVVDAYVHSVSPVAAAAPLQIEIGGAATDFFVRSRSVSKQKPITLTNLLPLCHVAIKAALGAGGMVDAVTPRAVAFLQSAACLDDVLRRLRAKIARVQAATATTTREVSLDRGALRPRRRGRGATVGRGRGCSPVVAGPMIGVAV